jgi:hypothetical protein
MPTLRALLLLLVAGPSATRALYAGNLYLYPRPALWGVPWLDAFDRHLGALSDALEERLDARASARAAPAWRATGEHYELTLGTPALQSGSLSAALSADGTTLEVSGRRRVDGCACESRALSHVSLPHAPKAEDIELTLNEADQTLQIKLARRSKAGPTPLTVKTAATGPNSPAASAPTIVKHPVGMRHAPEGELPKAEAQGQATQPLRFVPHDSATPTPTGALEASEKELLDKFRAAGVAAHVAVTVPEGVDEPMDAVETADPETATKAADASIEA